MVCFCEYWIKLKNFVRLIHLYSWVRCNMSPNYVSLQPFYFIKYNRIKSFQIKSRHESDYLDPGSRINKQGKSANIKLKIWSLGQYNFGISEQLCHEKNNFKIVFNIKWNNGKATIFGLMYFFQSEHIWCAWTICFLMEIYFHKCYKWTAFFLHEQQNNAFCCKVYVTFVMFERFIFFMSFFGGAI